MNLCATLDFLFLAALGVEPILLELAFYRLLGFPSAPFRFLLGEFLRLDLVAHFGRQLLALLCFQFRALLCLLAYPPTRLLQLGFASSFLSGLAFGLFACLRCGRLRGLARRLLALALLGLSTLIETGLGGLGWAQDGGEIQIVRVRRARRNRAAAYVPRIGEFLDEPSLAEGREDLA